MNTTSPTGKDSQEANNNGSVNIPNTTVEFNDKNDTAIADKDDVDIKNDGDNKNETVKPNNTVDEADQDKNNDSSEDTKDKPLDVNGKDDTGNANEVDLDFNDDNLLNKENCAD